MRFLHSTAFLLSFLRRIYAFRSMIRAMALLEIRKRYAGTFGGFMWSVVHPLVMIVVYWFVFSVGFKIQVEGNIPFIVVFCCGLIPWITFSDYVTACSNAIIGNPHLSTKAVFPTEILPVIHLAASLITHGIMLVILIIVLLVSGISVSVWNLQFLYYLFALLVFSLGLGWFFSAVNVFFRDVGQVLGVLLNIWFWMTPIVWYIEILPQKYHPIVKLNPMYYIVSGYQSSFVFHFAFWDRFTVGAYFWIVCLVVFLVGGLVFKKLKPEFAEVL